MYNVLPRPIALPLDAPADILVHEDAPTWTGDDLCATATEPSAPAVPDPHDHSALSRRRAYVVAFLVAIDVHDDAPTCTGDD